MNNPFEQSLYQRFTDCSQHSLPGTEAQKAYLKLQGFRNPIFSALWMPAIPVQNGAGVRKKSPIETMSLNLSQRRYQTHLLPCSVLFTTEVIGSSRSKWVMNFSKG